MSAYGENGLAALGDPTRQAIVRRLATGPQPVGHRYLLPDVCLSQGRFLDGTSPADLPRAVEIVSTDGVALRDALRPAPIGAGTTSRTEP